MIKNFLLALVIIAAFALSACDSKGADRHILTPTESDLQELTHEVEGVKGDSGRLRSDVERVRKILVEMEQSLDRVDNSTKEVNNTLARLQGQPIEEITKNDGSVGKTISWIIALLLVLVVAPIFILKYLQTRNEDKTWNDVIKDSDESEADKAAESKETDISDLDPNADMATEGDSDHDETPAAENPIVDEQEPPAMENHLDLSKENTHGKE